METKFRLFKNNIEKFCIACPFLFIMNILSELVFQGFSLKNHSNKVRTK